MATRNKKVHQTTRLEVTKTNELMYPTRDFSLPSIRPKLLVFDLDNTLWTPELYQIRQRQLPRVNVEIWLFNDAKVILEHLWENSHLWQDTELAVASRTTKIDWAKTLLKQFKVSDNSLHDLFPHQEIIKGSKKVHFENLRQTTGVAYKDMVFFDDDARMNLDEVSQLGVLCCHTPRGVTADLFCAALEKYASLKKEDEENWMGYILNAANLGLSVDESAIEEGRQTTGRIKFFSQSKRFGFVVEDGGKSKEEYFFHESKVAAGLQVQTGMRVAFETAMDGKGRPSAVILNSLDSSAKNNALPKNTIQMPCFSMSQPFAALLLNGIKTVETRNNPMFADVKPGTKVLLHCGQRDWKDLEAPKRELKKAGFSKQEIEKLSKLPKGFSKGSIIGVMMVGKTWESTLGERRGDDLQRKVVATTDAIGRFCTPVSDAQWLKRPVKARGNTGVYTADIPKSCLPDNFEPHSSSLAKEETKPKVWTISG